EERQNSGISRSFGNSEGVVLKCAPDGQPEQLKKAKHQIPKVRSRRGHLQLRTARAGYSIRQVLRVCVHREESDGGDELAPGTCFGITPPSVLRSRPHAA